LGYYYPSPVAADQKVYIASADGVVAGLDAGPALKVLATNTLEARRVEGLPVDAIASLIRFPANWR
jgi:hypothetical protein